MHCFWTTLLFFHCYIMRVSTTLACHSLSAPPTLLAADAAWKLLLAPGATLLMPYNLMQLCSSSCTFKSFSALLPAPLAPNVWYSPLATNCQLVTVVVRMLALMLMLHITFSLLKTITMHVLSLHETLLFFLCCITRLSTTLANFFGIVIIIIINAGKLPWHHCRGGHGNGGAREKSKIGAAHCICYYLCNSPLLVWLHSLCCDSMLHMVMVSVSLKDSSKSQQSLNCKRQLSLFEGTLSPFLLDCYVIHELHNCNKIKRHNVCWSWWDLKGSHWEEMTSQL